MLYKDAKFQRKSVAEVKADIDRAEAFYGSNRTLVKTAFLQDADPLTVRTAEVVEMLRYIRERFPNVERITAYARGRTIARKSLDDLKRLREAGLSRLHIGLETGYGPLLTALKKGATPEQMIEAGRKAKEADLCVSEYVMPGLGGRGLWREHAIGTAEVLNAIDADFIRLRTLSVRPETPLYAKMQRGELQLPTEVEVVHEIRLFIETLDGIKSLVVSDHIQNLLEEVEGHMPQEKQKMLDVIDEFLALDGNAQTHYLVGRRFGRYRGVSDLEAPELREEVEDIHAMAEDRAKRQGCTVEALLSKMRENMI